MVLGGVTLSKVIANWDRRYEKPDCLPLFVRSESFQIFNEAHPPRYGHRIEQTTPAYDENDTIAFAGVAGYKFSDEAGANVRSGDCAGAAQ